MTRHRRTDPACSQHHPPRGRLSTYWFDRNRGRVCRPCPGAALVPQPADVELPWCNASFCGEHENGEHRITSGRCIIVPGPQPADAEGIWLR